jgi:hypothetical protein
MADTPPTLDLDLVLENWSPAAKSRWTRIGKLTEAVEHVVPYRRLFWESG